tara:strand:- start:359 stop:637 length:279 start_codon:yes stop_codon:yes gene_type:complete
MKKSFIILLISFLLVFASSCNKLAPLEHACDKSSGSSNDENLMLKNGEGDVGILDAEGGITDPENDEDHDSDGNITDTDNDEDHDKENTDKG